MNHPRSGARIIVRARDPRLRSLIEERLAGLGEVMAGSYGTDRPGDRDEGMRADDAAVEVIDGDPGITPRESEVLGLLADGLANKEIGGRLDISAHTAKFHVESLLRKLGAANRAEAVKEGIRRGLIGV
jgi:DNA-binding CsgD family transcriptional regulator